MSDNMSDTEIDAWNESAWREDEIGCDDVDEEDHTPYEPHNGWERFGE